MGLGVLQKVTQHLGVGSRTRNRPTELTRRRAEVEHQQPAPVWRPMQRRAHWPPGSQRFQAGHFLLDDPDEAIGSAPVEAH